jgi:hypothetical protein
MLVHVNVEFVSRMGLLNKMYVKPTLECTRGVTKLWEDCVCPKGELEKWHKLGCLMGECA